MKKKLMVVGLSAALLMGGVVGCGETATGDSYGDEIVGKINDREIKRSEVMDDILEKQVVTAYINDEVKKEFLKEMPASEKEIEAQIEVYKMMVQGDWQEYLDENMGGSEDFLRERVELEIKEGKMFEQIKADLEVTEDAIEYEYSNNGEDYKHMVGNVLYALTDATHEEIKAGRAAGKSMKEIIGDLDEAELEYELKDGELLSFTFDGFDEPVSAYNVGDLALTDADLKLGEANFLFEVTKKVDSKEALKEEIEDSLKEAQAYDEINEAFEAYLRESKIEVMGQSINESNEGTNLEGIEIEVEESPGDSAGTDVEIEAEIETD